MSLAASETSPASLADGRSVAELTLGLVSANEQAYQQFFATHARRLLVYNLALCNGDEEAAKELLQQTMIRVAKHVRVFESEGAFWSWLTVVARSCWIDEHRKRKRYWSLLDLFRRSHEEIGSEAAEDPDGLLEEALQALEPGERELLEEKYIAGWSVREMAEAHDSSEKAIESKLSRARAKLRRSVSR